MFIPRSRGISKQTSHRSRGRPIRLKYPDTRYRYFNAHLPIRHSNTLLTVHACWWLSRHTPPCMTTVCWVDCNESEGGKKLSTFSVCVFFQSTVWISDTNSMTRDSRWTIGKKQKNRMSKVNTGYFSAHLPILAEPQDAVFVHHVDAKVDEEETQQLRKNTSSRLWVGALFATHHSLQKVLFVSNDMYESLSTASVISDELEATRQRYWGAQDFQERNKRTLYLPMRKLLVKLHPPTWHSVHLIPDGGAKRQYKTFSICQGASVLGIPPKCDKTQSKNNYDA